MVNSQISGFRLEIIGFFIELPKVANCGQHDWVESVDGLTGPVLNCVRTSQVRKIDHIFLNFHVTLTGTNNVQLVNTKTNFMQ